MRQLTLDKLAELRLTGMLQELKRQVETSSVRALEFEERLLMLLDAEDADRKERSLKWKLKSAGLGTGERSEELDYKPQRKLDRILFERLLQGQWLRDKRNLVLTGPTGIGKTFLASTLAYEACRNRFSARYFRAPRLFAELAIARAQGTLRTKLAAIARVDLLVLDDWLLSPLGDLERRDLLEIVDDRYDKKSLLICTQLPVENWHQAIGDPTLADAILDRIIHNAYRLDLQGASMRKSRGLQPTSDGNIDPA